jgi:hypothetical protein
MHVESFRIPVQIKRFLSHSYVYILSGFVFDAKNASLHFLRSSSCFNFSYRTVYIRKANPMFTGRQLKVKKEC